MSNAFDNSLNSVERIRKKLKITKNYLFNKKQMIRSSVILKQEVSKVIFVEDISADILKYIVNIHLFFADKITNFSFKNVVLWFPQFSKRMMT